MTRVDEKPTASTLPATHFRMPAEWESHEATWLAWPHQRSDWPGKFAPIPWVYGEIIRHLADVEQVNILVTDDAVQKAAQRVLRKCGADLSAVRFFAVPTNRSWTRDFCPIFVAAGGGQKLMLDWRFNGWAKYPDSDLDNAVTPQLAKALSYGLAKPEYDGKPVVLEGGSIDVNGAGSLLTTEECLLSDVQSRNPHLTRDDLQAIFKEYLGISNVLWLKSGIAGDDTHGHVDDLARFTDPHTIIIASEQDPQDANFEPLRENLALLREMKDQAGQLFRVVTLPMPSPIVFGDQRLPASYANFYIANGLVLVPTFNDPNDRLALNSLAELFPSRKIVGIACTDLVLGLGTLHCMTQQEPA